MSASKPGGRDAMLVALLSLICVPAVAQAEDLERFSESMIDMLLESADAEIEAAAYHDMLGTLDEELERGASQANTDSVNSEEHTGLQRAHILESER